MASSFASYASWLSVDDTVVNATFQVGSQQPQDEAEPPKPPTKRQCRSKASLLGLEGSQLSFSLSQSQPVGASSQVVDGSQSQPVDGSQSQQIDWATVSVVVIDGSQSQPVVDGS